MANQKSILSKELLISKVWGNDSDAEDNNVEAYISFLRKKIAFLGSCVAIPALSVNLAIVWRDKIHDKKNYVKNLFLLHESDFSDTYLLYLEY